MILIMTVEPGFGGQAFIPETLEKIEYAASLIKSSGREGIDLEVDGGISPDNVHISVNAGANVIVAGQAIFKAENTYDIIRSFRENAVKK